VASNSGAEYARLLHRQKDEQSETDRRRKLNGRGNWASFTPTEKGGPKTALPDLNRMAQM